MKHPISLSRQRGLSILELLLGLVVIGAIAAQAIILQNRSTEQAAGRLQADQLASFQRIAAQYFLSNRTEMEAAMSDSTATTQADTHCRISSDAAGTLKTARDTTLKTCAFDTILMKAKGLWPAGLVTETGNGGRYTAIFKYDAAKQGAEMLVVLAAPDATKLSAVPVAKLNQLYQARDSVGAAGGFVPYEDIQCKTGKQLLQACGSGWSLDLNDFVSSSARTHLSKAKL